MSLMTFSFLGPKYKITEKEKQIDPVLYTSTDVGTAVIAEKGNAVSHIVTRSHGRSINICQKFKF
jgi:hypothetical protein